MQHSVGSRCVPALRSPSLGGARRRPAWARRSLRPLGPTHRLSARAPLIAAASCARTAIRARVNGRLALSAINPLTALLAGLASAPSAEPRRYPLRSRPCPLARSDSLSAITNASFVDRQAGYVVLFLLVAFVYTFALHKLSKKSSGLTGILIFYSQVGLIM
jgi:hypothetical protein